MCRAPEDGCDLGRDLLARERADGELLDTREATDVGEPAPQGMVRGDVRGSHREDDSKPSLGGAGEHVHQCVEGLLVGPVQVVHREHDGPLDGLRGEPVIQGHRNRDRRSAGPAALCATSRDGTAQDRWPLPDREPPHSAAQSDEGDSGRNQWQACPPQHQRFLPGRVARRANQRRLADTSVPLDDQHPETAVTNPAEEDRDPSQLLRASHYGRRPHRISVSTSS